MRIGIVSDTHSRHQTVATVIELLRARAVEAVLHCGDIEDAETVLLFEGLPVHFVFGNCDTDRQGLRRAVLQIGATLHEQFGKVEFAGVRIGFLHGDNKRLLHDAEQSGSYDFLFYGHTHQAAEHRSGATRVINPGALHRARPKTFILLDLPGGAIESVVVN